MLKKQNRRSSTLMCGLALIAFSELSQAAALTVYGKIHVSADIVDNGQVKDYAIGSNSSRIGFKGIKKLKYNLKTIWKLESDIDVTNERTDLKARNRYLGLKHSMGTFIVGYHDTPFKTLGGKAGVLHDTIAERRGILGSGNGSNKFNTRARNAFMYISPKISGIELRGMYSVGNDTDNSLDKDTLTSVSVVYKSKKFYVGVAVEDQSKIIDATGLRVSSGIIMGKTKINVIYEKLSSDTNKKFDRAAYGGSLAYKMGDTTLKAQAFMMNSYTDTDNSGALILGLGVEHKLDKKFTVYAVAALAKNEKNAKVQLAASDHGEKFSPAAGDNPKGVSIGMIFKF